VPANCPYPEPARSSPCPPHPTSWRFILILSSHRRRGSPSNLLPSGLPIKTRYAPLLYPRRATFPAHLILLDHPNDIWWAEDSTKHNILHWVITDQRTSELLKCKVCLMSCAREKLKLGRLLGCGEHELLGTALKTLIKSVYVCISLPERTRASLVLPGISGSLTENGYEASPSSCRMGSEDILPGIKPQGVKLTTHLWCKG